MTYLLIILTGAITILQIDNLKTKSFDKKAWLTLGCVVFATIITFFIESNKSYRDRQEKKVSDSLADLRVSKSNRVILTGIGDAIGKYGLKYDSAKKELDTLKNLMRDSSNRKSTIYYKTDSSIFYSVPNIEVSSINLEYSKNKDSIIQYITFSNTSNVDAYHFNFEDITIEQKNGFYYSNVTARHFTDEKIKAKGAYTITAITINKERTNFDTIFIYIKSSYSNYYKKVTPSYNKVFIWNFLVNSWGEPPPAIANFILLEEEKRK
jgi:hypothetical protein